MPGNNDYLAMENVPSWEACAAPAALALSWPLCSSMYPACRSGAGSAERNLLRNLKNEFLPTCSISRLPPTLNCWQHSVLWPTSPCSCCCESSSPRAAEAAMLAAMCGEWCALGAHYLHCRGAGRAWYGHRVCWHPCSTPLLLHKQDL